MKIIGESSSTRTEWALVEGTDIVEHAFTTGINPFFQSRREISHCVRLELPDAFFRRRWDHVYFYCAGCSSQEKKKIVENSLVAQFKTPVTVETDLLGAARGLLVRRSGLACIMGTGSNSCLYNGQEIVKNVAPLGYVLGDEGSGAYLGKMLISDLLKELAPRHIARQFFERYNVSTNKIMDEVYMNALPSRTLAEYATFLQCHASDPYVHKMVYDGFMAFFRRNIVSYDYRKYPLCFVGSTGVAFEKILRQAADDFGATVDKVIPNSMPGLVEYHLTD